jgi:dsDNA-binding SOS-regulon protein
VDLDQLIDDELLKILSKTCVQLEDEQINDLDMILHKLKEENIHYEMNARMKMKFE